MARWCEGGADFASYDVIACRSRRTFRNLSVSIAARLDRTSARLFPRRAVPNGHTSSGFQVPRRAWLVAGTRSSSRRSSMTPMHQQSRERSPTGNGNPWTLVKEDDETSCRIASCWATRHIDSDSSAGAATLIHVPVRVHRDCRIDAQAERFVRHGITCSCSREPGREARPLGAMEMGDRRCARDKHNKRWISCRPADHGTPQMSLRRHCVFQDRKPQTKSEGTHVQRLCYSLRTGRLSNCSERGMFYTPASHLHSRCSRACRFLLITTSCRT